MAIKSRNTYKQIHPKQSMGFFNRKPKFLDLTEHYKKQQEKTEAIKEEAKESFQKRMNTHLIKRPVITEKSAALVKDQNKYTFQVSRRANKNQIKTAIEEIYGVDVESVNVIRGYRVMKTTGRKRMKTILAPTKKAIVRLKKGQSISLFDFGEKEKDQDDRRFQSEQRPVAARRLEPFVR